MLTTFYFDQELFSDESLELSVTNSVILDKWFKYGCLAVCPKNKNEIIRCLKNIPNKHKQKWITALTSNAYKRTKIDISKPLLSTLEGMGEFEKIFYANNITTGILVTDYQELFQNKSLYCDGTHLEIVTPENIDESINFKNSERISEKDIKAGEIFTDIWVQRFGELARHTSIITILDRYMALDMEIDLQHGKKTSLENLLENLSKYNKNFTIDIYSACDIPSRVVNASRIKSFIDNTLRKKPYFSDSKLKINFSLCKNKIFGIEAHDRMICFDNHVIQIGKGMDLFRDKKIENNTFTIKPKRSTFFDNIYKELTRNREWTYEPASSSQKNTRKTTVKKMSHTIL